MFSAYYRLTKPGIIRGNTIVAAAGFLLAAKGTIDWWLLLAMIIGLAFIIASACVANNIVDRGIDARMSRTQKRALVTGTISLKSAVVFSAILLLSGMAVMLIYVNSLALMIALFGWFAYVVLYGYVKRTSVHGTLVGTISGSVPPVIGYVAVTNSIDELAILLFLVLVFWQMPHFYAIAIYRKREYAAASIPVLSIVHGINATKFQMNMYMIGFVVVASSLTIFGHTGLSYLAGMLLLGGAWLRYAARGETVTNDERWAKQVFGLSLFVLLGWSLFLALEVVLP